VISSLLMSSVDVYHVFSAVDFSAVDSVINFMLSIILILRLIAVCALRRESHAPVSAPFY